MNRVLLVGRLTRDPELQTTQSGIEFVRFTLAIDKPFESPEPDYIPVVVWRQQANFVSQYIKKGNRVSVEGRFNSSQYEKDGEKKTSYDVQADRVQNLTKKQEATSQPTSQEPSQTQEKVTPTQIDKDGVPWELDL